ncbi:TPA: LPXTG cell wall anchor domain-containing protein [Streptococcus suis]|nr:LPXTG cell wall anchor domain-containing protein [Streptococcus suis]
MKIKRSSSKKQLHKWTKLGVGLAAVTVLGGLVESVGLTNFGSTKVYAEESKSITYRVHYFLNDTKENGGLPSYTDIAPYKEGTIIQGETITEIAPQIDGYVLTKETWNSDKDVVTYDKMTAIEAWSDAESVKSIMFFYDKVESSVVEKPAETPAEKQVTSSEISFINLDGSTYSRGDWGDEAIVGTATVEHEVGGELTIPATVVPAGYEITDIRFNILSTGVKELPYTWTYEEYKNYTSAPMSVPEIDILVKPVSSPATPAIPTVPVDQSITIKAVYTEEQIEPGQKVDVLKEIEYTLKPGESVVLEPLAFEGWTSRVVQESQTVTYEEAKARPNKEYYFYYIEEGTTPTEKPIETPAETPTEKPAEQLVEKPTEQPVEKPVKRPTASPTAKPTEQSAPGKQATKQGDKEPAAPASQSKQSTVKPASTSQSQAKSLPATGEASSVLHLTGLGLLGLAGLVVKRRPRKSS